LADIFVSYARSDKARVAPLVAALEDQGWSVWWDPAIIPGQEFDREIIAALDAARAVIVVWTPASVDSRWVRGEAREAADRNALVPVRFAGARLPLDARSIHTTDLDEWNEDPSSVPFQSLLRAIRPLMNGADERRGDERIPEDALSVAVLPFVNMSPDKEQDYFSDGLSEEMINQLAQIRQLRVAGRTSSFAFKDTKDDFRSIGRRLGVAHILEGSVRKAGNRLRITAQLIKVADGFHLWSKTFDRELYDVFAIQDDIALAVADALKVTLGVDEASLPGSTRNVEAYDLYLRGQASMRLRGPQNTQRAVGLFQEAVELDPNFSTGWLAVSIAHIQSMIFSPESHESSREAAREAFERAKTTAPDSWMVQLAEANRLHLVEADLIAADRAFNAASVSAPPAQFAAAVSYFFQRVGRLEEALEQHRHVVRDDPFVTGEMLQFALDSLGRYREAVEERKRVAKLAMEPALNEWFHFLRLLASEGSQSGKAQFKRYLALKDDYLSIAPSILANWENKAKVIEILRHAFEDPSYRDPSHLNAIAFLAAFFGDDELALDCFQLAYVRMRGITVAAIWHPLFERLRQSEGFKQLVRDLGIHEYWRTTGCWGDFARPVGEDDFEIIR
jgi:adenylate cyclase